jgi:hypothetical protein
VLVARCYKCHSAASDKVKGELLLDTREGIRRGGETGESVVPGNPEASLLIEAIRHESLKMPPDGKLSDDVIAKFVEWIKMGAPDPRGGNVAQVAKTIDWDEARKHWSFQPPKRPAPPSVKDVNWPRTDVDRFILARLEAKGLKPVSDADRRVVIRRLYFDLVGLPPTPEEVETFVADNSPRAVETVVDRLLASPQFGERWGRHWLDVVRFAESNGNVDNVLFPQAWRYRDYVIDAFNADTPYDKFVAQQVAGDLLAADSPRERNANLLGTGLLALGSKPRSQNNPNYGMDLIADEIEVVSSAFMGLTVACARCHDHKFDPIPTTDYYAMAGIFTSSKLLLGTTGGRAKANAAAADTGLHVLVQTDSDAAAQAVAHEREVARLEAALARLHAAAPPGTAPRREDPDPAKKKKQAAKKGIKPPEEPAVAAGPLTPEEQRREDERLAEVKRLEAELADLKAKAPPAAIAGQSMGIKEGTPGDCAVCIRGETQNRGPVVPRGFVTVLTSGTPPAISPGSSGRLELAQWLTSPEHPLTARVYANRAWSHLFDRGIVPTVDNFGALGEPPTHPELLDYLAVSFREQGWSIKGLIKSLVLTRTYQLSSAYDARNAAVDAGNEWLWRQSPRRLDGESIRDAMLAVSGSIDLAPPRSSLLREFGYQEARGSAVPGGGRAGVTKRSVYLPIVRNVIPESLAIFDFPDASLVVGDREVTTVPAQALYFMNSPFVIEQSRALAQRLLDDAGLDDAGRIDRLYLLAYARHPSAAESERAANFLAATQTSLGGGPKEAGRGSVAAWSTVAQAILASAEFRYLE